MITQGPAALRDALAARGWSQGQLARALGVTRGAVCQWLSGATRPNLDRAAEIEHWLEVPCSAWSAHADGAVDFF